MATRDATHWSEAINDYGLASARRWPNRNDHIYHQYVYEGICENDQQDWPILIPLAELCYNTTVSRTTGKTPFYLCYRQEAVLASDLSFGQSEFTRDQERLSGYYSLAGPMGCAEANDTPKR